MHSHAPDKRCPRRGFCDAGIIFVVYIVYEIYLNRRAGDIAGNILGLGSGLFGLLRSKFNNLKTLGT